MIINHEIAISVYKNEREGRYEITVKGVTSGCVIHFGDGDDGTLIFRLDASRFQPIIVRG